MGWGVMMRTFRDMNLSKLIAEDVAPPPYNTFLKTCFPTPKTLH